MSMPSPEFLVRKFIYGPGLDEPICLVEVAENNAVYYYHFDGLGSVVALSDVNSVLVERYTYDVFGRPTIRDANGTEIAESAFANPYLFTGRAYDAETGLYYYRARYYDYATGRFLQPDPTGYRDGLNLYSYCGNNPFNFLDPSGLCRESLFDRAMNVVGAVSVPVALTCLAVLYPPVGVALLMFSGFMGGLYVGEGAITGVDIYGNPLSASERVYRTAIGGLMIGTSLYAAGQMQAAMQAPPVQVIHFTDSAGAGAIARSGSIRAGSYVTLPSEVEGLNVAEVESALGIQAGRGAFSTTFRVPQSQLAISSNGPLTSGGRIQFQLTRPATPGPFIPTRR